MVLETATPGGRLVSPLWRKFIRKLIVQGTHEGLDTAQTRGQRLGRPAAATAEQIRQARGILTLRRRQSPRGHPAVGCLAQHDLQVRA
ncbi:hypothetical protein [Nocardia abscessus]|uniref:hypothetical protein n=1 Tax=Nocardia abscessus TaxID=120957 RepID=UPI0024562BCE|nr:hypothetical protein [Nocardia abscessus]